MLRIAALIIALGTSGVFADDAIAPVDPELGRDVDFDHDIAPLIEAKCLACHNRSVHENDLVLESFDAILKGGGSGPGIVPGKPDESLIYKVCARQEEPFMPPQPNKAAAAPLTPRELGLLRLWIESGARPGEGRPAGAAMGWRAVPDHLQSVYSLALSPGERFVAAGRANRIAIYELPTRQLVTRLADPAIGSVIGADGVPLDEERAAHLDFVEALAFSPDGNWLASGAYREIKLWKRLRDVMVAERSAGGVIRDLAVSADGARAAVVLEGNVVPIWNLANGEAGPVLQGFAAAPKCVAVFASGGHVLVGCDDGLLRACRSADGTTIAEWNAGSPVRDLAVTNDDAMAATGHADGKIRVWTVPTATPAEPVIPVLEIAGSGAAVVAIQIRNGTHEAAVGFADGEFKRINLDNGAVEFANRPGGSIAAAAIAADGTTMVAAAGEANFARLFRRDGNVIADVKTDPALVEAAARSADDVAVAKAQTGAADAAVKAAEKDVTEREASLKSATEARQKAEEGVAEPQKKVDDARQKLLDAQMALAAAEDDEALKKQAAEAEDALKKEEESLQKAKDAVTSAERAIQLSTQSIEAAQKILGERKTQLSSRQQQEVQSAERLSSASHLADSSPCPVRAAAVSPDSRQIATAGDDGQIHLWDAATGKWLETLHGCHGVIRALAYTAAGMLVSAGDDQMLRVWNVQPQWELSATLGGSPMDSLNVSASPIADRVLCLAFSPDGTRLASGGGEPSRSGEIVIWDVQQRTPAQVLNDIHSDAVFGLEYSRDGLRLASCGADKFVKVTDTATGTLLKTYEGHTAHVLDVSWKADGSTLASAGADGAIKIWDAEIGEQRRTISNSTKQVTTVTFIGTSENIVAGSGDASVRLYNTSNGGNLRTFGGSTDYVFGVVVTRDEKFVAAAGEDGMLRIWNGKTGESVAVLAPETTAQAEAPGP